MAPAAYAASATSTAKPVPVTVGALFPNSGPLSLPGDEAFRGVLLARIAAQRHASAQSREIRLIRAGAADAADAAKAARRLIHQDHADLILGTCSSTLSFAASAAAELANIPYVELDAPADGITTRGFKTLLRTGLTTTDLARGATGAITARIAPAFRRRHQDLRLALLFDAGATDGAFAAAMAASCKAAGLPVLMANGYDVNAADLTSHVARMKRADIDVVVHAANPDGVALFFEAMANLAWRPRGLVGTGTGYGLAGTGFLLERTLDGVLVVGPPLYQQQGPSAAVAQLYQERFAGMPRGAGSLSSFAGAFIVFQALMAGHPLPAALQGQNQPSGALVNGWGLAFDKAGQNVASFATLQQWRAGRLVTIAPKPPDQHG